MCARPRIERNEIYLGGHAFHEFYQPLGIGHTVIDTFEHDIFKGDTLGIGSTGISASCSQQFGNGIFPVERHQLVADFIGGTMQGNGKAGADFLARPDDFRHYSRGG